MVLDALVQGLDKDYKSISGIFLLIQNFESINIEKFWDSNWGRVLG